MTRTAFDSLRSGLLVGLLAGVLAALAGPAAAYVVVTSDNQVYEVPTRPEIRDEMVYFTLDGVPVSMRIYDLNVGKTNEYNYRLDSGSSPSSVAGEARQLREARPEDNRIIVSHPLGLKGVSYAEPDEPDYRLLRADVGQHTSFGDSPGPRRAPNQPTQWPRSTRTSFGDSPGRSSAMDSDASRSRFADEARRAYDEAGRASAGRARADDGRMSGLDAELAAEQAYLRRLTSGEEVVDDLDREIDRSMEKIRQLQGRRGKVANASDMPVAEPSGYQPQRYESSGRFPAGSREAKWEATLAELRERRAYYQQQQAGMPAGSTQDREVLDERIGEIDYRIDKLERKLSGAARR